MDKKNYAWWLIYNDSQSTMAISFRNGAEHLQALMPDATVEPERHPFGLTNPDSSL